MVLGRLAVPGRPSIWMIVGQGPNPLSVGAGGVVCTFLSRLPQAWRDIGIRFIVRPSVS